MLVINLCLFIFVITFLSYFTSLTRGIIIVFLVIFLAILVIILLVLGGGGIIFNLV